MKAVDARRFGQGVRDRLDLVKRMRGVAVVGDRVPQFRQHFRIGADAQQEIVA
jgi:hypothetical protein